MNVIDVFILILAVYSCYLIHFNRITKGSIPLYFIMLIWPLVLHYSFPDKISENIVSIAFLIMAVYGKFIEFQFFSDHY